MKNDQVLWKMSCGRISKYRIAKENKCLVSFGSDAHKPEEIKDIIQIKEFLEHLDFQDKDIFEPNKRK